MTPHDPVVSARLAILPFALVEWTVVFMYVKLMTRPEIARPMRVFLVAPFIVALLGTVFGQLNVYTATSAVAEPLQADAFVRWVVLIENLLAAALLFRMLRRRRTAK
jgi:hypothetical protein